MTEPDRGTLTAVIITGLSALCLVALALVEHKDCKLLEQHKIGNMVIAQQCGTEREREAVNE